MLSGSEQRLRQWSRKPCTCCSQPQGYFKRGIRGPKIHLMLTGKNGAPKTNKQLDGGMKVRMMQRYTGMVRINREVRTEITPNSENNEGETSIKVPQKQYYGNPCLLPPIEIGNTALASFCLPQLKRKPDKNRALSGQRRREGGETFVFIIPIEAAKRTPRRQRMGKYLSGFEIYSAALWGESGKMMPNISYVVEIDRLY